MPGIIELYHRYYNDGLIGQDIVDLLKLWARIPQNEAFITLFLQQHILPVITQFYKVRCTAINEIEAQKMIDSSVIKVIIN